MIVALDTDAFGTLPSVESLPRASNEQVSAVVLPMDGLGKILEDLEPTWFSQIGNSAARHAIRLCALSAPSGPNLGALSSVERQTAYQNVLRLLTGAKAAGTDAIVIRPFASSHVNDPPSDANALGWVFDALRELRHEAEALGVHITLDTAEAGVLPSPAGAADFLDVLNSHAIGWQLDLNALPVESRASWLGDLSRSLQIIRVPAAQHDQDALLCELREIGYAGVIAVSDIAAYRRWSELLDGDGAAIGKTR